MKKVFLVLFTLLSIGLSAQNFSEKIDIEVWMEAQRNSSFEFFVILKEQANTSAAKQLKTKEEKANFVFNTLRQTAEETQGPILRLLQDNAVPFRSYYLVNAVWVKGNIALAEILARREDVARIAPNPRIKNDLPRANTHTNAATELKSLNAIEWGISMIRATDLWNLNFKGAGVVIGGQDTGYDWIHPAISGQYRGTSSNHNYHWHDAIHGQISMDTFNSCGYDSKVPCDDQTHGTHTMGTMVGDDGTGNQIGVAPEAKWIGCRNMENGWGSPATYIECFEWFLAPTDTNNLNPDPSMAPHVINNSWSCPPAEGCNNSNFAMMQTAVENLKNGGTFVTVSAGNSGGNGCGSIDAPAAIFEASFSVGATNFMDSLVGFSSRGYVSIDSSFRMKPNVSAPGVDVRSCVPGGAYANYSGTSMAGPHVAGAVALLISVAPQLAGNVDSLETLLELSADSVYAYRGDTCGGTPPNVFPNNMVGYGRINLYKALQILQDTATSPTGIIPSNFSDLQVFPNPFSDKIYLNSSESMGDCQIRISNMLGQTVFVTQAYFDKRLEIQSGNFPAAVYIITVENKERKLVSKIVRQ